VRPYSRLFHKLSLAQKNVYAGICPGFHFDEQSQNSHGFRLTTEGDAATLRLLLAGVEEG
jgi:hypothetical protein